MLVLSFEHPANRETHTIDPVPYVRIVGASLLVGPDDDEVARYEQGLWHIDGKAFTAIRLNAPAMVRVEANDSNPHPEDLGTFEHVGLVDGAIRHGPKLGALLARLNEDSQFWLVYPSRNTCSILVLSSSEGNGDDTR